MIIAIGGEPATGKTTMVTKIIRLLGSGRCLKYKKLRVSHFPSDNLFVLGIYFQGQFSGTDKLSMNILDDTKSFVRKIMMLDNTTNILFEGDRLFNTSFLEFCKTYGLKIFVTKCSEEQKKLRHIKRNDNQSESFIKSRKTKIENIEKKFDCIEMINETEQNMEQNIDSILCLIKRKNKVKIK